MSNYSHCELDRQMKTFADRHFEKPSDCKNVEQIQFYIQELCEKIREYELRFQYVPQVAYLLLNQYNMRQNAFVARSFQLRRYL